MKSISAAIALTIASCGAAAAMPVTPAPRTHAPIVLVRGGCGPAFHRGPYGGCVPNGERVVVEPRIVAPVRLPPPCPRGYYRDPRPGVPLCYPRF